MKKQKIALFFAFAAVMLVGRQASAQTEIDSTGFPGDGLSLEAVLDLFKKSESLEDFEKKLNQESNEVNNLDINEDGKIDYIRVVDNMEKESHAIVLQVPVNEKENQDVAVITVEKTGKEEATLQIIGDEDVYGEEKIVEPFEEETQKSGKNGPAPDLGSVYVVVNVWHWAPVRYVYHPTYVVYRSPWAWGIYPTYWRPWRPRPYVYYYPRVAPYHVHYHPVTVHRCYHARGVYAPRRTSSTTVHTRTTTYKTTRTTTTRTTTTTTKQQGRQPATTNNNQPSREAAPAGRQPTTTNQPSREAEPAGRQPTTTNQPSREAEPAKKASSDMQMSREVTPTTKEMTKNPSSRAPNTKQPGNTPSSREAAPSKSSASKKSGKQTNAPQSNQGSKSTGAKKSKGSTTAPRGRQGRN
ncbi:MAG: hypothetical protein IT270_04250 [Saprospiraceae bacterium]|nr:hypothetical protein [Saprospiraceae bacterium]